MVRAAFQPPPVTVWRAVHAVLPLLRPVMHAALTQLQGLADALLGALSLTAPAQQGPGGQPPPLYGPDRAAVQWYAAGCAAELCRGAGRGVWAHTTLTPGAVLDQAIAAMGAESGSDERLQKGLVEALQEALSCLPPGESFRAACLARPVGGVHASA